MSAKRIVKWAGISAGVLVVVQAIRPARTNPPIDPAKTVQASSHVPASVAANLDRGCRDCHSNETVWPWYTNVAPVSWWIVNHVNEGRRKLNFSDWADLAPAAKGKRLTDICKEVEDGGMPLSSYVREHPDAKLSDEDRQAICAWTKAEHALLGPLPPEPARGR